jgi:hypothetical protein
MAHARDYSDIIECALGMEDLFGGMTRLELIGLHLAVLVAPPETAPG